MAKTLVAVFPENNHAHLFEKFTKQFKNLKGKFDIVFVTTVKHYKYLVKLQNTKFKQLQNTEICDRELEQNISSRNLLRDYALKNNYNHVLFLDSDMLFDKNLLVDLLSKEKDIITAGYLNFMNIGGEEILAPPIYKIKDDYLHLLTPKALEKPMMIEIGAAALSCCLVTKDVLERLSFRKPHRVMSESISFFEDAVKKLGFKAWFDTQIQCSRQPFPDGDERNTMFLVNKKEDFMDMIKTFHEKLPKFSDGRIDYTNSDTAPVVSIFVKHGDEILLLKRSDKVNTHKGKWNNIGGYIDELKPIKQKALEELNEETGINEKMIASIKMEKPSAFFDE